MTDKTIAIACDHGGLELKNILKELLAARGLQILDLGTDDNQSVDYPDYGYAVAAAIRDGRAGRGVLCCGTGIGISIAANRYPEIRAALVHDAFTARMSREHNDANVICFGGRTTGPGVALDCLEIFLDTPFGGDRHSRRVGKLSNPA
ncbi:MAG: ribose 5-phosphate isomerase B [Rhodospirillales bacterium]|nr:ribose 5-phosphate isomerase B [Rhodospirillales bacterium]